MSRLSGTRATTAEAILSPSCFDVFCFNVGGVEVGTEIDSGPLRSKLLTLRPPYGPASLLTVNKDVLSHAPLSELSSWESGGKLEFWVEGGLILPLVLVFSRVF